MSIPFLALAAVCAIPAFDAANLWKIPTAPAPPPPEPLPTAPQRTGYGTGLCRCGRTISFNKEACRAHAR